MERLRHISYFLGLKKSTVGMLGMVILVGMGERMAERFLPIYLIALGGGAISIGLLNGLDNLLSVLRPDLKIILQGNCLRIEQELILGNLLEYF